MSAWTPAVGELFYANCVRVNQQTLKDGEGNTVAMVKSTDRSYCDYVFRMVALDDRTYIADIVYGSTYGDARRMLLRKDFNPIPVGPAVAAALDLQIT